MIYAIGLDTDSTFTKFLTVANKLGYLVQPLNLRSIVATGRWNLELNTFGSSFVDTAHQRIHLDPLGSYYCRLISLREHVTNPKYQRRWSNLVMGLSAWLETKGSLVVNRPNCWADNGSKPLHETNLVSFGFDVPKSITSSTSSLLEDFCADGPTIVKTISGIRATCRAVEACEVHDYDKRRGPIHLQRYIAGYDVRVHCVQNEVFATRISTQAVDYRMPNKIPAEWSPHQIDDSLKCKIVKSTAKMGMLLTGWDFKVDLNGRYWCLEANPMPGYSGYDHDGSITKKILNILTEGVKSTSI